VRSRIGRSQHYSSIVSQGEKSWGARCWQLHGSQSSERRQRQPGEVSCAVPWSFPCATRLAMIEWHLRAANKTRSEIGGQGQPSSSICLHTISCNPSVLPALETQLKESTFLPCSQDVLRPHLILSQWLLLT
jgi:hypothetical protein